MDMLHGAIGGKLLRFSLPIAFTDVAEQLFNSADVLLLGQFVGKDAMAAVGNDIPAISLLVLLLLGLSTGANVVLAQHIGGRHEKRAEEAAHTVILVAILPGELVRDGGSFGFWLLVLSAGGTGTAQGLAEKGRKVPGIR